MAGSGEELLCIACSGAHPLCHGDSAEACHENTGSDQAFIKNRPREDAAVGGHGDPDRNSSISGVAETM